MAGFKDVSKAVKETVEIWEKHHLDELDILFICAETILISEIDLELLFQWLKKKRKEEMHNKDKSVCCFNCGKKLKEYDNGSAICPNCKQEYSYQKGHLYLD